MSASQAYQQSFIKIAPSTLIASTRTQFVHSNGNCHTRNNVAQHHENDRSSK